ncbi:hypothetical protein JVU11DRAFT_5879 [Chiua virens]|nr:hypothetical protein JVU11DRAFT_5879 [Chiua virens]
MKCYRSPHGCDYGIKGMIYKYSGKQEIPEGWTACQHPDGAQYFLHDESKTFTEVDICDAEIHEDTEYFRTYLYSELGAEMKHRNISNLDLNIDEVELVLESKADSMGVLCCYYFVNPRTRTLFWLDDWEA